MVEKRNVYNPEITLAVFKMFYDKNDKLRMSFNCIEESLIVLFSCKDLIVVIWAALPMISLLRQQSSCLLQCCH